MQRLIAQLPWGHNVDLLSGLDDAADRVWYAEQAVANGWSRGGRRDAERELARLVAEVEAGS